MLVVIRIIAALALLFIFPWALFCLLVAVFCGALGSLIDRLILRLRNFGINTQNAVWVDVVASPNEPKPIIPPMISDNLKKLPIWKKPKQ